MNSGNKHPEELKASNDSNENNMSRPEHVTVPAPGSITPDNVHLSKAEKAELKRQKKEKKAARQLVWDLETIQEAEENWKAVKGIMDEVQKDLEKKKAAREFGSVPSVTDSDYKWAARKLERLMADAEKELLGEEMADAMLDGGDERGVPQRYDTRDEVTEDVYYITDAFEREYEEAMELKEKLIKEGKL